MTRAPRRWAPALLAMLVLALAAQTPAQRPPRPPATPGPMLDQGTVDLDTPDFRLTLVRSSQTVAGLRPKPAPDFDFTPGDRLMERSQDGYYHLGDLDLRVRTGASPAWSSFSTAQRRVPVTPLDVRPGVLAAADLTPAFGGALPLRVTREWRLEGGTLVLQFTLENRGDDSVEVGALGIPMVFNNILSDRSLDQAHAACVFFDPYIGQDAGYLQVTRLSGQGPALLVLPHGHTPFEAYSPILDPPRGAGREGAGSAEQAARPAPPVFTDPTPRGTTFEGFHDWMVHSRAFADQEWKGVQQWNPPTSVTLAPGAARSYGVSVVLAESIRGIERTLSARQRPVAVGVPGYILPNDIEGRLFLKHAARVSSTIVEPAGALSVRPDANAPDGWHGYTVRGQQWGRARLAITYDDGLVQAIHYKVIKPAAEVVADLGRFQTTRQWFDVPDDLFGRSPSVMSYDRDENRIVTQDSRVWIAGLGDEGGSSWLAGAMKQLGRPDAAELAKYQRFVDEVVWGRLQYADGPKQYGVRKSLFYYQPDQVPAGYYRPDFNWTTWTSWNREATEAVNRSYDYPHVAALYWTMYRLARNHVGLVSSRPWAWYLERAYRTSVAMVTHAARYAQFGQMEGTIFVEILRDLQREGWTAQADDLEKTMRARAEVWMKLAYPFGSEMPWDSTGQEEVYAWTRHFKDRVKARVTLEAIVAYMPAVPHWAYNGSARRYWDFVYAGKVRRIERQLHHYGSGLNAIPVLTQYRDQPDDLHLLRIGYGGVLGAIANIDQEGFASAAFHSFPDMLRPDPYTGDYAQNFLGHALNTATYLVRHPELGWLAFGGNVEQRDSIVGVVPLDSFRSRVYIAPAGLWLTLDAGRFERVEYDADSRALQVVLAPASADAPVARLRVEQPASIPGIGTFSPGVALIVERGAFVVPLSAAATRVTLTPR